LLVNLPDCLIGWLGAEHVNKSVSAFEEAVKKEQLKTKELEEKFNEKIVKHSVSHYIVQHVVTI